MIPSLKILMVCPAPPQSLKGNRVTTLRWARLLRELGHRVSIREEYDGSSYDLMIALHARKSADAVRQFAKQHPQLPIVVALTGTDLYRDIRTSRRAQRSLDLSTRLVILQDRGLDELKPVHRPKTRVILQSAERTRDTPSKVRVRAKRSFKVCVIGHLRYEKDPLRTAMATRLLPDESRIHVVHLGAALNPSLGKWARAESKRNPRYTWFGEVSYSRARRVLAQSDLMALTSRMEGGANVLSEAIADSVPIVASDIPSTVAILGANYPGLYPVGDTTRLAAMLLWAETDTEFYERLKDWCVTLAPRVGPSAEREAWNRLIQDLCQSGSVPK